MAEDPYQVLGVARGATAEDVRKAYRKLAKELHPDMNPGNKVAEEKFKAVSAANEMLSDPEKRARYDRGEIDGAGAERAQRRQGGGPAGFAGSGRGFVGENFEDIFSNVFGQRGAPRSGPLRGEDAHYRLEAGFLDAVNGATQRLTLPDGQVLDVKIPAGTEDGDVLRLRARGNAGHGGGPAGDALIEIGVVAHAFFRRDGQDIHLDLPVSVAEAVLGLRITVPTPGGAVAMKVRAGADTGTEMRLRGRGVPARGGQPAGDLYARLRVVIGPVDAALEGFLRDWQPAQAFDPRAGMAEG